MIDTTNLAALKRYAQSYCGIESNCKRQTIFSLPGMSDTESSSTTETKAYDCASSSSTSQALPHST